ncbi:MAG: biopolymer transport protein ExbD [Pseudomonadota bacterium]
MAFGRLERHRPAPPIGEINMTPLIDVMLVLLVIFIITAPLMASRLALDLPTADGAQPATEAVVPLVLALDADGRLHWGDEPVAEDEAQRRLLAAATRDPATEVQLRADARVPYGRVAALLDQIQQAGLSRIGFVTAPAAAAR